jgi:hypothetical protein
MHRDPNKLQTCPKSLHAMTVTCICAQVGTVDMAGGSCVHVTAGMYASCPSVCVYVQVLSMRMYVYVCICMYSLRMCEQYVQFICIRFCVCIQVYARVQII